MMKKLKRISQVVVNHSVVIPSSHEIGVLQRNNHRVVPLLIFRALWDDHTAHRDIDARVESQNLVID